ncbi:MAG TPA: ABC transporter permease [Pyrinomonadaceae bacterium]|nr:ABC transporter permease [Pyrinomonadaceae bacterium]
MGNILQDVRYGLRMLLKSRGVTAAALVALALGIGANTAIFSVVNAVLLRPLPYKDADRIVILRERTPKMDLSFSYPNFQDLRDQNEVVEDLAAFRRESFNLTGAGEPERLSGRMVSHTFFTTLGAEPQHGRVFAAEDDRTGAPRAAVLSHGFWQRRFAADPALVGKQLTLNGDSYTVVGVAAPGFAFGAETDVYVPIGLFEERYKDRGAHPGISIIGRMRPGVTLEQARAGLDAVMARLEEQYPDSNKEHRVYAETLYENTVGDVRTSLYVLLGAVAFVLLIACANVANLLLARSAGRQKEIAIRTAMGASRWRIVRQLLTESVLLSVAGGALGLLVAVWGTDLLVAAVPDDIPRLRDAGVNARVLLFTLGVSVVTGLVFGLVPAFQASRPDLNETLKEGERGSTGARQHVRSALVVAEVAVALVLLVGAGLMVRSFWRLQSVATGFDPANVLTMQLSVTAAEGESRRALNFFDDVAARVRRLPGVEEAAFTSGAPFIGATETSVKVDGQPEEAEQLMTVQYVTTPEYLRAMGLRLKRGRYINEEDRAGRPVAIVIDERLAEKAFPGEDPVGRRLSFSDTVLPPMEVVGVVEHVKHYGLTGEAPVNQQLYLPLAQVPEKVMPNVARRMTLVVRTKGDPLAMTGAVRQQILAADPNQPAFNVSTMERAVAQSIGQRRFAMTLLAIFAAIALVLAAVGIYGVMSYSVTQRTHEIGIRMALGAQARDIMRLVVGQGMALAAAGVVLGVVAALLLTRVIASMLYGVTATDPATFAAIPLLLAAIALLACLIPARRATKVDPMVALRYE